MYWGAYRPAMARKKGSAHGRPEPVNMRTDNGALDRVDRNSYSIRVERLASSLPRRSPIVTAPGGELVAQSGNAHWAATTAIALRSVRLHLWYVLYRYA
jgi:hypothetical protein